MSRVNHTLVRMLYEVFVKEVNQQYKENLKTPTPPGIVAGLKTLKGEMDKLFETWSVMAGVNVMSDIVKFLGPFEGQLTGSSKEACIRLKQDIQKAIQRQAPSKARYHSVLCLGYKVKTTFDEGYKGDLVSDRADMETKVADMIKAIQAAYAGVDGKHQVDPTMLKIFMAPEFFFRGANGGYDFDDVNGLGTSQKSLVDLLRAETDKDIYKDWLFVLGTVIVVAKNMKAVCSVPGCTAGVEKQVTGKKLLVCRADPNHVLTDTVSGAAVDNMALIVKEKLVHLVAKELVSPVDYDPRPGVKGQVTVGSTELSVNKYPVAGVKNAYTASDKPAKFDDERMGGSIFTIDGITFGCEVCLDHARSSKSTSNGRLEGAHGIQIQLIPSGGMSTSKFRTVENGVIFNVDGAQPHVEAIGLCGIHNLKIYQSYVDGDWEAHPSSWERAHKDIQHLIKIPRRWAPPGAPTPGLSGSVHQYGPFEIPAA